MPSSHDESGPCSCCPYPGSFANTCQEAGNPSKAGAHDGGDRADARATMSPAKDLQPLEYQLSDPRSRQHTSPGPATAAGAWDSAAAVAPPETATPEDYWTTKIQAIPQSTSELYPGSDERPQKRRRYEFEADAPLPEADAPLPGVAPRAASHSTTCMDVLRDEIRRAVQTHLGSSSVTLDCTGKGHSLRLEFSC